MSATEGFATGGVIPGNGGWQQVLPSDGCYIPMGDAQRRGLEILRELAAREKRTE